jgi:hypothetical protein
MRCCTPARARATPPSQPAFAMQRQLAPYALRSDGRHVPLAQLATARCTPWPPWPGPNVLCHAASQGLQLAQATPCPITMILRAGSGRRIQTR